MTSPGDGTDSQPMLLSPTSPSDDIRSTSPRRHNHIYKRRRQPANATGFVPRAPAALAATDSDSPESRKAKAESKVRQRVAMELLDTELRYVSSLQALIEVRPGLAVDRTCTGVLAITHVDLVVLYDDRQDFYWPLIACGVMAVDALTALAANLVELLKVHRGILEALQGRIMFWNERSTIADIFLSSVCGTVPLIVMQRRGVAHRAQRSWGRHGYARRRISTCTACSSTTTPTPFSTSRTILGGRPRCARSSR